MFEENKFTNLSAVSILYVEDDLETREELQFILEHYVAKLYIAKNGREGLALYREHQPDIVVTDIQMPEMNGLSMAADIRSINPEQAIVIISAYNDVEYLFRALELGIQHYITKPVSIDRLLNNLSGITERKQLTEDLNVAKQRLELAVECGGLGVWDLDLIRNTCWRSLGHDQIFGYEVSPGEWNKVIAMRHIIPDDQDKFSQAYNEALDTGKLLLECRIIHPDQSIHWISVRGRVIYNEVAQPIRILGTVMDTTEQQNRKQKAKEHLDQLAHVTRLGLMGEMSSGIAHEVNQPLTAIATYAQVSLNLIKKETPDLVKLAEVAAKTQEQALRAGQIIHRMKEFCKSKSQQRSATDINELINQSVKFCADQLKQNSIGITLKLQDKLPFIPVDHIQIEQVLINLIRNAMDAILSMPEKKKGEISIQSYLTPNHEIQVSVKDNGPGIQEDQQFKILMPFHTTKAEGMGMGLSISRSLIEAHDGTLSFNSELGKGCIFYFTLPI